ncbi:diguanylate cyclase domain-containing protein [Halanaerobacter jeridensis]|uniref:Diguanylate cyclase (GGDEF)-like protein/PAS domain S-box-containing protein n=1 Tax=Halanaerobacter jeridensis TaxID=706427 RepID=A0A938XX03_9FIRM|nr:diguanylate cyclase [Halanaerobacter jeridensis]MBM7556845.1 diguanylate cyclase (GGDEF)-like protein/PAS domain S-box-containing protein [Halanaerobacter jeridensis]
MSNLNEQKLKKEKEELKTTLNSIGDAVISTDIEGNIVRMNPVAELLTGWKSGDAIGKPIQKVFNIINAKTRKKVENPVNKVLEEKKVIRLDNHTVLIAKDGSEYKIDDSAAPIINEEEKIIGVVLVFRDVTEKYKQQNSLRKNKDLYQKLFSNINSGVVIYEVIENGEDFIFKNINKASEKIEQIDKDEVIGKSVKQVFPGIIDFGLFDVLQRVWRTGKAENHPISHYEDERITGWRENYVCKLTSKEIVVIYNDITKRKKRENQIESQKQRLKNIIDGANVGTWEWNVQTGETIFNEKWAEMIGYTLEEISPTTIETWKKFTHPNDLEKAKKMLDKHFKGELDQYRMEIRMKHKNGDWVWVEDKGKVISWTKDNKPELVYGTHLNINKRKKAEKQLKYKTFHDELTGLYNRAYFKEEITRYDNKRQLPLSIIIGDINGLKITNDTFGHNKGDKLLKNVAQILENSCRQEDLVARIGGDEFVILLPQTSKEESQEIYTRIKNACQKAEKDPIKPSIALGSATKKEANEDFEKISEKAENSMYQNKIHESTKVHNIILDSLKKMLKEKSNETLEHRQRLEILAVALGKKLDLSPHKLNTLILLADLHDIGKITISKEILKKPGALTDKEWDKIKEHPTKGYEIANSSSKLNNIAEGILCHHEHWDGNGYPHEIAGENIPLSARIISIVDAYDIMTSGRPYKEAISKKEALKELKNCAGSQFDPKLVEIFIDIIKNKL